MELPNIKILEENNKILRNKSKEVTFPLSDADKQIITDMMDYLELSQIEESRKQYNLRAGMGLAFIQLGIAKRIFVVVHEVENEDDEQQFERFVIINPKIISTSEELIYVGEGEGCLSVNRDIEGIVPRHARMKVKAYDENGEEYELRVREEISILFQHEIDHLNGILFIDHIDKKNPFKNKERMREI